MWPKKLAAAARSSHLVGKQLLREIAAEIRRVTRMSTSMGNIQQLIIIGFKAKVSMQPQRREFILSV
jgi:hypothetical protein